MVVLNFQNTVNWEDLLQKGQLHVPHWRKTETGKHVAMLCNQTKCVPYDSHRKGCLMQLHRK